MTVAQLFDTVLAFFAAENWEVSPVDAQPAVSLEFQGEHGQWTCFAEIRQPYEQFLFLCGHSSLPRLAYGAMSKARFCG
jgi:hypothetical protein